MPRVKNVTDQVIKLVLFLSTLLSFAPSSAPAQTRNETLQAIAKLKGSERDDGFAKALAKREI